MLMSGACSSELDEAQPLSIGTTGSDAAFSYYDKDKDGTVSARELHRGEVAFGATAIRSEKAAEQVISHYDFDGDGLLDNLEFTGLVQANILAGVLQNPEWTRLAPH
jgi:hypothetical protein